jgi:hypothetical protein
MKQGIEQESTRGKHRHCYPQIHLQTPPRIRPRPRRCIAPNNLHRLAEHAGQQEETDAAPDTQAMAAAAVAAEDARAMNVAAGSTMEQPMKCSMQFSSARKSPLHDLENAAVTRALVRACPMQRGATVVRSNR